MQLQIGSASRAAALATLLCLGVTAASSASDRATDRGLADSDALQLQEALERIAIDHHTARALLADANDGRLHGCALLRAALVASGVHNQDVLTNCEKRFDGWLAAVAAEVQGVDCPRRRAALLLRMLRAEILVGGYRKDAVDLSEALSGGSFNCVSSVVLFQALAQQLDLDVCAITLPGHVFCRVHTRAEVFDVETTCRDWLAGPDDLEVATMVARQRGERAEDLALTSREITPEQLVGLVNYNRGVQLLGRREYAAAMASLLVARQWDPASETITDNLCVAANNWALEMVDAEQCASAVAVLRWGISFAPGYAYFHQNEVYAYQVWVQRLWQEGRYAEAADILDAAHRRRPRVGYFAAARIECYRREAKAGE